MDLWEHGIGVGSLCDGEEASECQKVRLSSCWGQSRLEIHEEVENVAETKSIVCRNFGHRRDWMEKFDALPRRTLSERHVAMMQDHAWFGC